MGLPHSALLLALDGTRASSQPPTQLFKTLQGEGESLEKKAAAAAA